jgi:hypothetical protein
MNKWPQDYLVTAKEGDAAISAFRKLVIHGVSG